MLCNKKYFWNLISYSTSFLVWPFTRKPCDVLHVHMMLHAVQTIDAVARMVASIAFLMKDVLFTIVCHN